MRRFWDWIKSHLLDGFLFAFLWEMLEELLEIGIAYILTVAILQMVAKVFTVTILTQGIKTSGKKLIFPLILKLTYREGNDKMNAFKKYWDKVWGNKVTGTMAGVGFAGIVWFQTLVPFATHCWWIALLTFVIFYNIGIFFGGETLKQIQERLAEATITKHQQKVIKAAQAKIANAEKEATKTEAEKAKYDAKVKEQKEFDAEVNAMVEKIKAEKAKKVD